MKMWVHSSCRASPQVNTDKQPFCNGHGSPQRQRAGCEVLQGQTRRERQSKPSLLFYAGHLTKIEISVTNIRFHEGLCKCVLLNFALSVKGRALQLTYHKVSGVDKLATLE